MGAKSYLSFTNVRGGPGASLAIPLMHKDDAGMRSHYLTIQFSIMDAPAPDAIVVALGASIGGRPHHRIGSRYEDLKELGGTAYRIVGDGAPLVLLHGCGLKKEL